MKNSNLRGAGIVFRYTVQQHYKTPSVIIFLTILFLIAVSAIPIAAMALGGKKESTETGIRKLYLRNETEYAIDAEDIRSEVRYGGLEIEETDADDAALNEKLTKEEDAAAAVVSLNVADQYFSISTHYGREGVVTHTDAALLNNTLESALHQALLRSLSVTEVQETMIRSKAMPQVSRVSDFLRGVEETNADTHVFMNIAYNYFIMMLCALSMGYIFQHSMEEKISKLVEMLMVSVSPTALLLGKILAVTLFIFGGLGLIAIGLLISFLITRQITDLTSFKDIAVTLLHFDPTAMKINAGTIVLLIICILLVYAISASLSGILGSCCSKTEDTQQASLVVVLFLMIGYLGSTFAPMFESDAANLFFSLFPVTSIFSAFPNYICGKIGMPVLVLALIIQGVTAALLMRLAGTVYKMMLMYRGGFPKPKQFIQMLKEHRAAVKAEAGKEDSHAV